MKPIVLCIDRDDDIGRKTGIKGPIIGREQNLEAAQKLALADPADTDVNALYGALKVADELETNIVTLTGEARVGLSSDKEIVRQLEDVLGDLNPSSIIFVSDGMDDEQVLPIIQSRIKVDSVQIIIVRQSKELEKAYFKLANFIKDVTGEPALARLIFGLPGIALLLLAVGGSQALSWILGVIGLYLIIKGFGWEDEFFNTTTEFIKSLSVERISTLLYVLAFLMGLFGLIYAYDDMQRSSLSFTDSNTTFNNIGLFILNSSSVNFIFIAIVIAIAARIRDEWTIRKFIHVRRYSILVAFIVLIKIFILDPGAKYMINEDYGFGNFIIQGLMGVVALGIWIRLTELFFKSEIEIIEQIIGGTEGKDVVDTDGRRMGKITKAVVENLQLKEMRIGGKNIPKNDIVSIDEVIVIKKTDIASPPQKVSSPGRHFKLPAFKHYKQNK